MDTSTRVPGVSLSSLTDSNYIPTKFASDKTRSRRVYIQMPHALHDIVRIMAATLIDPIDNTIISYRNYKIVKNQTLTTIDNNIIIKM